MSQGEEKTTRAIDARKAWWLLGAVILVWGVNWPVMKYGLHYVPPLAFAASRLLIGALLLAIVAALRGELRWPQREDMPLVWGIALLQMAASMGLANLGLQYVPAGRSSILVYTTPLWVVPLAMWWLGERLTTLRLCGLLIGLAGIAVLFNPFAFDWREPKIVLGNGLLLLSALFWAIMIVRVRGHRWHGSPLSLAPWQMLLATLILAPCAWLFEDLGGIRWEAPLAWVLLYNGPLASAFGLWAMISITRALPAITTSLSTLCVPMVGYAAAMIALGEKITASDGIGFALLLGGLVCASLSDWRSRQHPPASVS
jgi:drug/metabolite transporter (DMT)-like permease